MKVYNQNKTQILESYDLEKGYLINDKIHHEKVPYIPDEGYYKTIREYPETGGKDVEFVVTKKGQEYHEAYDEDIQVYIPYSEKELEIIELKEEYHQLKGNLFRTDYQAIKFAEGELSAEEFEPVKQQRIQWRKRINELQEILEEV